MERYLKCEDIEHLMMDYLEKNLDEETRIKVDIHLAGCEKCLDLMKESNKILVMISNSRMEQPDESLRTDFYHTLNDEIRRISRADFKSKPYSYRYNNSFHRIAAGVALLIAGFIAGNFLNLKRESTISDAKIEQLQHEVTEMKKQMMYSMINEPSSSYRLMAIEYTEDMDAVDEGIITALLNTLNNDDNVNVRMAAAFNLSRFTDIRMVCDSLIASLPRQEDPVIQVTLINLLVNLKEKSALRILQQMVNNMNVNAEVRSFAESGIKELSL